MNKKNVEIVFPNLMLMEQFMCDSPHIYFEVTNKVIFRIVCELDSDIIEMISRLYEAEITTLTPIFKAFE